MTTLVLAAYRWPDNGELAMVRQAIADAFPGGLSVVEAREREEQAIGATALMNAAARDLTHGRLFLARPDCLWSPGPLRDALRGLDDEIAVLELADNASAGPAPAASQWAWRPGTLPAPDALVAPAYRFHELGRLDETLWSVGEIEDFAARARVAGAPVTRLVLPGRRLTPTPFPLAAPLRQFLTIRNRLRTAFKTLPPALLGHDLAAAAAAAVIASARAAGFDRALLEGGQHWPRSGRRHHATASHRSIWPADEVGALVPLLALDRFVTEMAALVPVREDLQRKRVDPHAPCGPDTTAPADLLRTIVDAGPAIQVGAIRT